jgi:uncharacterized protein (TIGR00296 family)
MIVATVDHCAWSMRAIVSAFSPAVSPAPLPLFSGADAAAALFVTLTSSDGALRGCIGTLVPVPLGTGLQDFALRSAFHDSRFSPLLESELAGLAVSVSILGGHEDLGAGHLLDWVVGLHGITASFEAGGSAFRATFLPEISLEQRWTQLETIHKAIRKSGFAGVVDQALLASVRVTRFRSTKAHLTYKEYLAQGGPAVASELS